MVRATGKARDGFTLTELLVVIFIISVLVGMLVPALNIAKIRAQVAQAQSDISQLSNGIGQFKSTYGVDYVPNYFQIKPSYDINNNAADAAYYGYLRKIWGRLGTPTTVAPSFYPLFDASFPNRNSTNPPPQLNLGGAQCLVFFLGGYVSVGNPTNPSQGQPELGLGFSTSGTNPFNAAGSPNRGGVFFEFKSARLRSYDLARKLRPMRVPCTHQDEFPTFIDPWNQPYVYFTSINGNDYNTTPTTFAGYMVNPQTGQPIIYPFQETQTKYIHPNSFQIISAGPDGYQSNPDASVKGGFGPGGLWSPGQGSYTAGTIGGSDDLSNFHPRQLGAQ